MSARLPSRKGNRRRIQYLIDNPPSSKAGFADETEIHAHWAKYICVLISGFIEQAVKEILDDQFFEHCDRKIYNYINATWPRSRNMRCEIFQGTLENIDSSWSEKFKEWLEKDLQRKMEINDVIRSRNYIAHGEDFKATNVTLDSVKKKFEVACEVIDFLEELIDLQLGLDRTAAGIALSEDCS